MNFSGGRWFAFMLLISLLAHGGLFLCQPPIMASCSVPQATSISMRLSVAPIFSAPAKQQTTTTQPQEAVQTKEPVQTTSRHAPDSSKKRTAQAKVKKEKKVLPQSAVPESSPRQPAQTEKSFPASTSLDGEPQRLQKIQETTGPRKTSFDALDGPKFLQPPTLRYPRLAQRRGIEGQVVIELNIGADGKLLRASVKKSGGNGFDEAALEAVRKAKFRPAMHNGRPTACIVLLPIHFTLRNAS